jgi:hypothetical protein
MGVFPRITISKGESVNLAVDYPEGTEGDLVVIQAEDGGAIEDAGPVSRGVLDSNRQLRFKFTSTEEGGIYRITLRRGFDEKHLQFWGGKEPAVLAGNL